MTFNMKVTCALPMILDGGMGRELQRIGAPFQQPEWSAQALIESPHLVSQVHRSFIEAGADIITTNAYALVPFHIGHTRFEAQGPALIQLAAELARKVADEYPNIFVAGCIPPVLGSYRPDLFSVKAATPLLETLIKHQEEKVDIWLAETISSIAEAKMIKTHTANTGKPTWIAFTIKDDMNVEPMLRSGELVYDAVKQIINNDDLDNDSADHPIANQPNEHHHISAILFNCSRIEVMKAAIIAAKQALADSGMIKEIQIGAYANNFPPIGDLHEANGQVCGIRKDITAEKHNEYALSWLNVGATIIGGCCGISPQHIKKLSQLKSIKNKGNHC